MTSYTSHSIISSDTSARADPVAEVRKKDEEVRRVLQSCIGTALELQGELDSLLSSCNYVWQRFDLSTYIENSIEDLVRVYEKVRSKTETVASWNSEYGHTGQTLVAVTDKLANEESQDLQDWADAAKALTELGDRITEIETHLVSDLSKVPYVAKQFNSTFVVRAE